MKMTLLELTQRILTSIKGEQVDSISDTEESLAVASIIKECYYNIVSGEDLLEEKTLFELNPSLDPTKPVVMSLPDSVIGLEWVKYAEDTGTITMYKDVTFRPLEDFLAYTLQFDSSLSYVDELSMDTGRSDTILFRYRNDKQPLYYTSWDDNYLIFDSYNADVDTTLQKNKTMCFGVLESSWEDANDFVPHLDSQQFTLLLQEAKVMAWAELKMADNNNAIRKARRGWVLLAQKKNRHNYDHKEYYYTKFPDYGRRR